MKTRLNSIDVSSAGIVIEVVPPNQVTDSRHAKLIAGIWRGFANENEESPFVLAEQFLDILAANDGEGTLSFLLSESLTKFPLKSFYRWGDPNKAKEVSRAWITEKGVDLDVQADIVSELYHRAVSTEDIIEHVLEFRPGQYKKPLQVELEKVISTFRQCYGFRLTAAYARFLMQCRFGNQNEQLPF